MEKLVGVVERITHHDSQSGFCVVKIAVKGFPELVTVVGNLGAINVGGVIKLTGQWKINAKFGRQFAAVQCEETIPATEMGLKKYLGSGLIKGIGPVNAQRIVNKFRGLTLQVIEENPERLLEVEGIGAKRVEMIAKAWQEQKEIKNVMLFLQSQGVSTAFAVKIYKTYGDKSIQVVGDNPYQLAQDIWGIGFKTADKIAQGLGFQLHSPQRISAGIIYVLNEFASNGHCFLYKSQLIKEGATILQVEQEDIEPILERMGEEGTVLSFAAEVDETVYLPVFFHSEQGTAKRIKQLLRTEGKLRVLPEGEVPKQDHQIQYDAIQLKAIEGAIKAKFMVLTGGPGTGKTTTTMAIIQALETMGAKVLLCAPTGRAAKRLAETTGREAKTIHRMLEFKPMEGFKRNQDNPLAGDVLIVDESSMLDIILMYNLLKAVDDHTSVILVGDVDQLPSVGPGNVLKDIISSQAVQVVKLERIFRQAQGSMIITNAHKINKGQFPSLRGAGDRDFFFMEEEHPEKIVELIKDLCKRRLPSYYQVNPVADIQVLCPMQRGITGSQHLNQVLQEALNPSTQFLQYGGTQYRIKDKVMQIRNNYDKNVYNGDIGIISKVDLEDKIITVDFEGTQVTYEVTELDELVLAYAMTVHKSQGSEYPIVIAPFTLQHFLMLQRNLLYTCITRAKRVMILVGTKKAIGMAVGNNSVIKRNTRLAEWLQQE